jgi:thiamine-monophosphate kinase
VTTIAGLGESRLLELITPYLTTQGVAIAAGEDDAAALEGDDAFTVLSTDMSVEGVHFDLSWMRPEDAGWRALALALGDLAAKGAAPEWALISVAVPGTWRVDDFVGLFKGFRELAGKVHLMILGGDMSAIEGPAVISVTVSGSTEARPIPRSEARPGWSVAVTGPLGQAALALKQRRALRLEPLLAEGKRLNGLGLCCGDISDGLIREMEKFAAMSRAGCRLRAQDVPVVEGSTWQEALASGEEAELVCAGPEELIRKAGLKPIGVLTTEREVTVTDADGTPLQLSLHGHDHFA